METTSSRLQKLREKAKEGTLPEAKTLDAPVVDQIPSQPPSSGKVRRSRAGMGAGVGVTENEGPDAESNPSEDQKPAENGPTERNESVEVREERSQPQPVKELPAQSPAPAKPVTTSSAPTPSVQAVSRSARFGAGSAVATKQGESNVLRATSLAEKYSGRTIAAPPQRVYQPEIYTDDDDIPDLHLESASCPPWDNENIPAGSAFTEEEWLKAESENPGGLVFEMLSGAERGLVHYPKEKMNPVHAMALERSLLVLVKNSHLTPWFSEACVTINHKTADMGVFNYKAIVSRARLKAMPWINGSVLQNWSSEKEPTEQSKPKQARPAPESNSRSARFNSAPRGN